MSEDYLIPLKIRAWLDLSRKKASGEHVNSDDILKHKKDVFRLCQIVMPNRKIHVSPPIKDDMREFLNALDGSAEAQRITSMGIDLEFDEIIELLRNKYIHK